MQFFKSIIAVTALASITSATNTLTFVSQDSTDRSIFFTSAFGLAPVGPLVLKGLQTVTTEIPEQWSGNFWGVIDGDENIGSGALGEMTFNAWGGLTFFDMSMIVVPDDINNIKMIMPKKSNTPTAGCLDYTTVCHNAYNVWDENLASKSTLETEFTVLVGTPQPTRRHAKDISARAPQVPTTEQ